MSSLEASDTARLPELTGVHINASREEPIVLGSNLDSPTSLLCDLGAYLTSLFPLCINLG